MRARLVDMHRSQSIRGSPTSWTSVPKSRTNPSFEVAFSQLAFHPRFNRGHTPKSVDTNDTKREKGEEMVLTLREPLNGMVDVHVCLRIEMRNPVDSFPLALIIKWTCTEVSQH